MNTPANTVMLSGEQVTPGKIVCIGRNYVEHIAELGNEIPEEMVVFCKPNSAISSTLHSCLDEPLHYEAEICFMIIDSAIAAVGFGLDITKRNLQTRLKAKGLPWERAKAFDGSALFSSFVKLNMPVGEIGIELDVNDETRQRGDISLMMYKPREILQHVKAFMTLNDGDIVMTGTPKGVGIIQRGDRFSGRITQSGKTIIDIEWIAE